jgi:hypothetical protein
MWKIQLTNAELIKALLLKKDNFNKDKNKRQIEINEINKRQLEISLAWDRIEQGLHDDSFWYFLNEKEQSGTRIDMLFALLANEYNAKLPKPISENQNYFPFLVFWEVLKSEPDKEEFVETLWNKVEELYAEFRSWYADLDKYHIIGYLVSSGVPIKDIFKITRGERKHKILKNLVKEAAKIKTFDRIHSFAKATNIVFRLTFIKEKLRVSSNGLLNTSMQQRIKWMSGMMKIKGTI